MKIANPNICVDIETLGLRETAPIAQIALILFDEDSIYKGMCWEFNWEEGINCWGRIAEPKAIKFWMEQSSELQKTVLSSSAASNDYVRIPIMLRGIVSAAMYDYGVSEPESIKWWSRGKEFDFKIIESSCLQINKNFKTPWMYDKIHEIRTLLDAFNLPATYAEVPHHALNDCMAEVADIQAALNRKKLFEHFLESKNK